LFPLGRFYNSFAFNVFRSPQMPASSICQQFSSSVKSRAKDYQRFQTIPFFSGANSQLPKIPD
jgi:hypothetical protein